MVTCRLKAVQKTLRQKFQNLLMRLVVLLLPLLGMRLLLGMTAILVLLHLMVRKPTATSTTSATSFVTSTTATSSSTSSMSVMLCGVVGQIRLRVMTSRGVDCPKPD